jgi:hypothetical protein
MLWCLLLVYCKQVYATCFDIYLGHQQTNSTKHKLSYLNIHSCPNRDQYYVVL